MPNKIARSKKPATITLGGKEYELAPVNLNFLEAVEDEFGFGLVEVKEAVEAGKLGKTKMLKGLLYCFLKGKYPTLTKDKIGAMVPLGKVEEVAGTVAEAINKAKE